MPEPRWRQITEIFHGAIAIGDAAAREDYLRAACSADQSLRAEIDSLLAAHMDPTSTIHEPVLHDVRTPNRLALGTTLGPYRVEALVGTGGMGEVYRARDTRLGRTVALKILPTRLRANPQLLARFEREARVIAGLNHPHICTLFDIGRHEDIDFLVMELVEGETLTSRLRRGRLSIHETVSLTREVAEALAAAHAKGIVHRDIKPSNIIVTPAGHVKVVDFGLARESAAIRGDESGAVSGYESARDDDPTEPGVRVGTPRYMSPEQALGQPLDARTDLFSLGVVLFECLTGELPFEGDTRYAYLKNLLSGEIKSAAQLRPDVPSSLQAVLTGCLERDTAKRLDSAGSLAGELELIARSRDEPRGVKWPIAAGLIAVIGAVLVIPRWPAFSLKPATGTDVAQLRRFTTSAGEEFDSHFSPDEMWMSFISSEAGDRRLFAQQVDGGERRPVTLPSGILQSHIWSPDQKSYACLIGQESGWTIQIVPTLFGGDVPQQTVMVPQIQRTARLLRWVDRAIYLQVEESGRSPSLQRLDLDTSKVVRVTGPWSSMTVRGFDVRPDGRQVVWAATPSGSQRDDLWIADLNGNGRAQLTGADDDSRKRFPLWNGDRNVIYQSTRGGQMDLWSLDVETRQSVRITSDPGIERPESTSTRGSLSYQLTSQKSALWIWNGRDGGGTQISDEGLSDFAPSASEGDRLRIAFQRSLPSPAEGFLQMDSDIFVAEVPGPASRLATLKKAGTGLAPRLSPDGKLLAYLQRSSAASAAAQLLVRNVETSALQTLSSLVPLLPAVPFPVDWTEQGVVWASADDLYFVERGHRQGMFRIAHYREGSSPRPLPETETASRLTEIYPSPDGQTIAYLTQQAASGTGNDTYRLHAVDAATGRARAIANLGSPYITYLRGWLRDGTGLIVARALARDAENTRTFELLIVSPDGAIAQAGTVDKVASVSRFMPQYSDLYFTRSIDGIGNLFAYSFSTRKSRQVSQNSQRDVTFGSAAPLGASHVVGIRHEQTKDIHLLDARPRANRRSPGQ